MGPSQAAKGRPWRQASSRSSCLAEKVGRAVTPCHGSLTQAHSEKRLCKAPGVTLLKPTFPAQTTNQESWEARSGSLNLGSIRTHPKPGPPTLTSSCSSCPYLLGQSAWTVPEGQWPVFHQRVSQLEARKLKVSDGSGVVRGLR